MKTFITATFARAGGWLVGARRVRAAMMLLLFLLFNSLTALAQTEGPWTYNSHRSGCCSTADNASIAFNGLDNSHWGNLSKWQNTNGVGFTVSGNFYGGGNKNAVYSVYTHTENVPSYTRMVLNWNYSLRMNSNLCYQTVCLYACENINTLKATKVDFTEQYTNKAGSGYCIYHYTQTWMGYNNVDASRSFTFDNRNSSSAQSKTWAIMLTHVIGNNNAASSGLNQWASIKNRSYSWSTYYYLYVTFDANGGTGSMSQQNYENSGTLPASTMTRDGYIFGGWNTKADGTGTFFADKAAITASLEFKGPVKLYAQWLSIPNELSGVYMQKDRKVKLTWNTKSGTSAANGKFVVYRNDTKIGTVAHTFDPNGTTGLKTRILKQRQISHTNRMSFTMSISYPAARTTTPSGRIARPPSR